MWLRVRSIYKELLTVKELWPASHNFFLPIYRERACSLSEAISRNSNTGAWHYMIMPWAQRTDAPLPPCSTAPNSARGTSSRAASTTYFFFLCIEYRHSRAGLWLMGVANPTKSKRMLVHQSLVLATVLTRYGLGKGFVVAWAVDGSIKPRYSRHTTQLTL